MSPIRVFFIEPSNGSIKKRESEGTLDFRRKSQGHPNVFFKDFFSESLIPGSLRFLRNLRGQPFLPIRGKKSRRLGPRTLRAILGGPIPARLYTCFTRSFRAPISDRCPEGTVVSSDFWPLFPRFPPIPKEWEETSGKKGEFFPIPGPFSERKRTGFPRTPKESGEISE